MIQDGMGGAFCNIKTKSLYNQMNPIHSDLIIQWCILTHIILVAPIRSA